ncbi:MAG: hypothetical protein AB7H88_08150 [Vicinamibacterales bacterium]
MTTIADVDSTLVARIRAEFLEMPGLRLTPHQAERLWGLDRPTCEAVLARLTATHVLVRSADGRLSAPTDRP